MYYTKENGTRLLVFLLDVVLHQFGKGAVASLVALNDLPALLVYDDNMIVFVNDFHDSKAPRLRRGVLYLRVWRCEGVTCSCHRRPE